MHSVQRSRLSEAAARRETSTHKSVSRPGERRARYSRGTTLHRVVSAECTVRTACIVDCARVIAGRSAERTQREAAAATSTVKLSLAMEGVLERRVLALEMLDGLGSASRRLPLELENLQGAGCELQGAGCRVQGAGGRVQGASLSNASTCRVRPTR